MDIQEGTEEIKGTVRAYIGRYPVAFLLVLLLLVETLSLPWGMPRADAPSGSEPILRLSEIDGRAIDSGAAMIINDDGAVEEVVSLCSSLPVEAWIFLLFAYALLLIYNFSFRFKEIRRIHWRFEAFMTLAFLLAWYFFDECFLYLWFPLAIIKTGIIIFALYIYLFEKKRSIEELLF